MAWSLYLGMFSQRKEGRWQKHPSVLVTVAPADLMQKIFR